MVAGFRKEIRPTVKENFTPTHNSRADCPRSPLHELNQSNNSVQGCPSSVATKRIIKTRSKCGMSHTSCRISDVEEDHRGPPAKRFKMNTVDTQNNNFLFTSESVGEGHPGKAPKIRLNF